jgi:hypothetical protein
MNRYCVISLLVLLTPLSNSVRGQNLEQYDFRQTHAFQELSVDDKEKLLTVHRDLTLLWGALDLYAEEHEGDSPEQLSDLVPRYLIAIPQDPFAMPATGQSDVALSSTTGYRYEKGNPKGWSWVIGSVGLKDFPYLSSNHRGLIRIRGVWISGYNITK